jgi:hypothetical protein
LGNQGAFCLILPLSPPFEGGRWKGEFDFDIFTL